MPGARVMAARLDGGAPEEVDVLQQESLEPGVVLCVAQGVEDIQTDPSPEEEKNLLQHTLVGVQSPDMCNKNHESKEIVSRRVIGLQQSQHERGYKDGFFVSVVFPGLVTREGCCIFTCELLKHILHQRQQLPLPYGQLANFYRKQQQGDVCQKKSRTKDVADLKKCQRVVAELEEILHNLEMLFTLTLVPRVLIMLGGSTMCPKELYEINMEGVLAGSAEQSLKTPSCLRKLFHSLFVADAFSEFKSSPLMGAVLMVQGHRNCGTDWFRPKLNFKVPNRGRKLLVNLSCSEELSDQAQSPQHITSDEDYVWFQAPVTIKGFHD
ncbi:MAD2L1-binding protein [Ambystoma mexicanum]|uniref:MAD2L1-binding protein n=1 Tax=Ambystoma mexicanum TaxID=8296 RepID=UPI0037E7048F